MLVVYACRAITFSNTHHVGHAVQVPLRCVAPFAWLAGNPVFPDAGCQMPGCSRQSTVFKLAVCGHRACAACKACPICLQYIAALIVAICLTINAAMEKAATPAATAAAAAAGDDADAEEDQRARAAAEDSDCTELDAFSAAPSDVLHEVCTLCVSVMFVFFF